MDTRLIDESICPAGKYKGYKMKDIPHDYLLYVYENNLIEKQIRRYVAENIYFIKNNKHEK